MALRDCSAWRAENLTLSTTNNETAKFFDDVLTQYVTWTENEQFGGITGTLQRLHESDTEFVMGRVLTNGLELMGTARSIRFDENFSKDIVQLEHFVTQDSITPREKLHCKAVLEFAHGQYEKACEVWEEIIQEHPNDIMAIKFAHDAYFYLGNSIMIRDSVGRVLPHWKPSNKLYGYLQGMYAFGLEETNLYSMAESYADSALSKNSTDCWATHAKAHCLEMTGRFEQGIEFLQETENDWSKGEMLACHNYWHWALYHIEKGEFEKALGLYDLQVSKRMKTSGVPLDIVDAASLLKRFELENVEVGDRWNDVYEICRPHIDDHLTIFNDIHYLMTYIACLGSKEDVVERYMSSLQSFCSSEQHFSRDLFHNIGVDLARGLVAYSEKKFDEAVELWYPLKLHMVKIGGSNAQRDIFQQLLIDACLSSKTHSNLAQALVNERKLLKENSPLTDRLMCRLLSQHN